MWYYLCKKQVTSNYIQDNMNISEVISDRIKALGKSQAEVARHIETSPSQLGLFLKGKDQDQDQDQDKRAPSLSTNSLNKLFDLLQIDLMIYKRRNELAKSIARALKAKGVDKATNLTREDIIALTGETQLRFFQELDNSQLEEVFNSGLVDPESTYNYMKDLIEYYLTTRSIDKITDREAEATISKMTTARGSGTIEKVAMIATGAGAILSLSPSAVTVMAGAMVPALWPVAGILAARALWNRSKDKSSEDSGEQNTDGSR